MNIQLRFFASVREKLGTSQEIITVPEHVHTVGEVRAYLRERGGAWAEVLADGRALRMAYNQEMADAKAAISESGEIAFLSPVTGG